MIAAGHRLGDVADYTIPQFFGFLEAVEKTERAQAAQNIQQVAVASQGDSKSIQKALDALTK